MGDSARTSASLLSGSSSASDRFSSPTLAESSASILQDYLQFSTLQLLAWPLESSLSMRSPNASLTRSFASSLAQTTSMTESMEPAATTRKAQLMTNQKL